MVDTGSKEEVKRISQIVFKNREPDKAFAADRKKTALTYCITIIVASNAFASLIDPAAFKINI